MQEVAYPGATALVIEDEPLIAAMVAELLEMDGFKVYRAETAAEAEAVWAREMDHIDLIVADYTLPGRCGFEMAREFASRKPDLKIILTSGHSDLAQNVTDIPGAVFLRKPFGIHALQQALEHVFREGRPVTFA